MSTSGVELRMREAARFALARTDGVISGEAFGSLVEYARRGPFTEGERAALLNPYSYLEGARGVDVSRISFSPEARSMAAELVGDSGLEVFPGIGAEAPGAAPSPAAPTQPSIRESFISALETGKDLGSFDSWQVSTAGADVSFVTQAFGKKWPALVLNTREFTDPEPARNLVAESGEDFAACAKILFRKW